MSKQTSLLRNPYFKTQVCQAIERLHMEWDTTTLPHKIHPYNDVSSGEVLSILVDTLSNRYYGPRAGQQKMAFCGCYVGLMLEIAHRDGIAFDAEVLEHCKIVRQWYRKYLEAVSFKRSAQ